MSTATARPGDTPAAGAGLAGAAVIPIPTTPGTAARGQLDGGRCDGFLKTGNDVFAISYYKEQDLGFIPAAAKAFTAFDHFHCSLMGATLPNREYMHAAQSYGERDNNLPPQDGFTTGFPDTTIFAALERAGVSNRYFFNDVPVSALWGAPGLAPLRLGRRVLRALCHRDAAPRLIRGPQLRGQRGGGAGTLGRRASARRRPRRAGVHVPTSSMPSSSRRSGRAARSSSSTTSGEASSTTWRRRGSPTSGTRVTSTTTTARWASESPRSASRRTCGAATWTTAPTASSRS